MYESVRRRRRLAAAASACLLAVTLAGCGQAGHRPVAAHSSGMAMPGMDMGGMDMSGSGDDMPGMGVPSGPKIAPAVIADTGLRGAVGGYAYAVDALSVAAGSPTAYTFRITGPSGKSVTRFQPYEGQLLVFYVVRADLGEFRRLTASMRDDGSWTVPMPALHPGAYRTYVTFAAPDSGEGTPLSYSLSQPLTVPGAATAAALPPAASETTTDGFSLKLAATPHQKIDTDLAVTVSQAGKPVQQFDRFLDGYAHMTAFHSGDAAFARALSTGRAAGGSGGGGALTAEILFPEAGTWRLFVQFQTSGVEHTASFTVDVP